jgi:phosphohistidine swiveling domain-containing protein
MSVFAEMHPECYTKLQQGMKILEAEVDAPVEVEFTVEDGQLYFLQYRKAKLSPRAQVVHVVRQKHAGKITRDVAVEKVPESVVEKLSTSTRFIGEVTVMLCARGMGVTPGAAFGVVTTSQSAAEAFAAKGVPFVLVRPETTPDDFPLMLKAAAIVTREGGTMCHAAVVARHLGKPAVIGLSAVEYETVMTSAGVTVDGERGFVYDGEVPLVAGGGGKEIDLFLRWRHGALRKVDSSLCLKRVNTNQALSDFYLFEMMALSSTDATHRELVLSEQRRHTKWLADVFATYLVLAVSSEVTHAYRFGTQLSGKLRSMQERYPLNHRDRWGDLAIPEIVTRLQTSSASEVAAFFAECRDLFQMSGWDSAYGGKAWADIAHVGEQYFKGEIPAAVFVDRVFDLRHNGGPVFNKHPMVSAQYSPNALDKQLDAKRRCKTLAEAWDELSHYGVGETVRALYQKGQQSRCFRH